mgnify:CR=1 FL=1
MLIPVKCFTCGKVIANKYRYYQREVNKRKISKSLEIDKIIYLNGLEYIREFNKWTPNSGFELSIGKENGKKSNVAWQLQDHGEGCSLTISIYPYKTSKVPRYMYAFIYLFIIKPKLGQYLTHVLKGLEYYLDYQTPVEKNHFGQHPWFSQHKPI